MSKPPPSDQPKAEAGVEAMRHIGGAAGNAQERAEKGERMATGLVPDASKGTAPKEGGTKS